jgi:hypothetical protein
VCWIANPASGQPGGAFVDDRHAGEHERRDHDRERDRGSFHDGTDTDGHQPDQADDDAGTDDRTDDRRVGEVGVGVTGADIAVAALHRPSGEVGSVGRDDADDGRAEPDDAGLGEHDAVAPRRGSERRSDHPAAVLVADRDRADRGGDDHAGKDAGEGVDHEIVVATRVGADSCVVADTPAGAESTVGRCARRAGDEH